MKAEKTIQSEIMLALGRGMSRVFRNNVGVATTRDGSVIRYGLCNGSSDLIGWESVTVTPDMIGRQVAVFKAVEVKKPGTGRLSAEQTAFLQSVRKAGGISGVATSVEEAQDLSNTLL